jgi:hypothetical protein
MPVSEFQAKKIERIAESLAHFVRTTRDDKLDWNVPGENGGAGRSVLEMVGECIVVNRRIAALLRGEPVDSTSAMASPPAPSDVAVACDDLIASGREMADAVRQLDDAALSTLYTTWRGPLPGEIIIEMGYRNMAYHAGQVNFIQCLYGDPEFHLPPTWI